MSLVLHLVDEAATRRLGQTLAKRVRPGDVVALFGTLGTGKSTLARAFIRALTSPDEEVPSPTFTLLQQYEAPDALIWHFDLYRLEKPDDALELDIEEAFADGICLIEWPEQLGRYLPKRRLDVMLETGDAEGERRATLTGHGSWAERIGDITQ